MIHSVIRPLRALIRTSAIKYGFSEGKTYIPIRPLKQERNVLFDVGTPTKCPFIVRLLSITPFLGFTLEGLTSEWTYLVMGGCVFGVLFYIRVMTNVTFFKAHEAFSIVSNKSLSKFSFTVVSNMFTRQWQNALLKANQTTFQQRFLQKLKQGSLNVSEKQANMFKSLSDQKLRRAIVVYQRERKQIELELDRKQIAKFQMRSMKSIKAQIKDHSKQMFNYKGKDSKVFEDYSTENQIKPYFTIRTRSIEGKTLFLYADLPQHTDNKYQEYLKALAEGKTIVNI